MQSVGSARGVIIDYILVSIRGSSEVDHSICQTVKPHGQGRRHRQKVGGGQITLCPLLQKVGGTCPPVHPMIDAHAHGRRQYALNGVLYKLVDPA